VEPHYSTENPNVEIYEDDDLFGLNSMRILAIKHQKFHVMINLIIQGQQFFLKTLIDSGSNINVLNKKEIVARYW